MPPNPKLDLLAAAYAMLDEGQEEKNFLRTIPTSGLVDNESA